MEKNLLNNKRFAEENNLKYLIFGLILLLVHVIGLNYIGYVYKWLNLTNLVRGTGFVGFSWYFLLTIVVFIFFGKELVKSIKDMSDSPKSKFLYAFIVGVIGSIIEGCAYLFVYNVLNISSSNQDVIESTGHTIWLLLETAIFAPIVEETIFRGIIYRSLRNKSVYLATFLTALLFAFYHIWEYVVFDGEFMQLVAMIIYFFPALTFGLIYEKTENLLYPIMTHGVCNFVVMIYMFIV